MSKLNIKWIGHACFEIEYDGYRIITDPYQPGYVPGLGDVTGTEAEEVVCTHGHSDHSYKEGISLRKGAPSPFKVTRIPTFHDNERGALRGESDIILFEAYGFRAAHMGDIGCPLTDEQAELLKGLDAVLIPVGGTYTLNAGEAFELVKTIDPKVVIPMHFRDDSVPFGYENITEVTDFTSLFAADGDDGRKVNFTGSPSLALDSESMPERSVVVLVPALSGKNA